MSSCLARENQFLDSWARGLGETRRPLLRLLALVLRGIPGSAVHAEDVLQETYLEAWRQRACFLGSPKGILPWLRQIALLKARNLRRVLRVREVILRFEDISELSHIPVRGVPVETRVEREEERSHVLRALEALESTDRCLIALVYFDFVPVSELARSLGLTDSALRKRLNRAVAKLRHYLGYLRNGMRQQR